MNIDKFIQIIKELREEAPTMSVGSGQKSLGYNLETETPPVRKMKKRKKYATLGPGSRKRWMV